MNVPDSDVEDSDTESSQSEDYENDHSESESDEEEDDDDDESSSDLEDNTAYQDWLEEAAEATEEMRTDKYEKYINQGMDEDSANVKANRKVLWAVEKQFFNNYKDFLSSYLLVKDNFTHQEIVEDLEEKVTKGIDINRALGRVITKHRDKFRGLFHQYEGEDNEEDND